MVWLKWGYMCKIELDGTQGRTAKINNRRPTHL